MLLPIGKEEIKALYRKKQSKIPNKTEIEPQNRLPLKKQS